MGGLSVAGMVPGLGSYAHHTAAPSDTLRLGVIGVRNQGFSNLRAFLKLPDVQLVAISEIDDKVVASRSEDLTKAGVQLPTFYKDYRKMLDNKDLDAVIVATPDHWHCLQLADCLSADKHVFCEKPVANSLAEAQLMVNLTAASGKIVQVNQWQRSQKHFKDAVAFVQSGQLGTIINTKTWMHRGTTPLEVKPDENVPPGVDYDLWLGPASKRPFNPNRFHYEFRWFWDYAGGLMCDWGVHLIDIVLWAMKADSPKSIASMGGKRIFPADARETPDYLHVSYDFGAFTHTWEHYMGIGSGQYGRVHGIAFVGTKGTLVVDRRGWEVIPEKDGNSTRMEALPLTERSDNGLELHARNFVDVIKSGKKEDLACPIEAGANVAIVSHMGNIALRAGDKISWDKNKFSFDNKAANALVTPEYQNGFRLPR